jgi:hypothetical protein
LNKSNGLALAPSCFFFSGKGVKSVKKRINIIAIIPSVNSRYYMSILSAYFQFGEFQMVIRNKTTISLELQCNL